MATVRMFGSTFVATPIEKLPNGNWRMRAEQHAGRCIPGTEIEVKQNEIVEMAAAESPTDNGQAALEAAMAKERETLPSAAELIAKAPKTVPEQSGVSVPSRPSPQHR